jgi:hypothetical protein
MNRFRNALLATAAALLIVQALLFTSPGQALAQNVASVLVANTAANPVPVRDVDNGRQPVILSGSFSMVPGQDFGSRVLLTVPAGKRLVVETVSVSLNIPQGQFLHHLTLTGNHHAFELTPTRLGTDAAQDWYSGTFAFRAYVDPGAEVVVFGARNLNATGFTHISAVVSGYYIDVP